MSFKKAPKSSKQEQSRTILLKATRVLATPCTFIMNNDLFYNIYDRQNLSTYFFCFTVNDLNK